MGPQALCFSEYYNIRRLEFLKMTQRISEVFLPGCPKAQIQSMYTTMRGLNSKIKL